VARVIPPRTHALVGSVLAALALGIAAASTRASPLESQALWVGRSPAATNPQQLASQAAAAGARTLFIKAAEGTTPEAGFTPAFVGAVRAAGISVCAWTFVYGVDPAAAAIAAIAAGHAGAQCLVVDAEGQYDKRYGAAQLYVRTLRSQLGSAFPIGLAGQAEIAQHPTFPYSVFLGPGGFNVDMPQVYWRDLGLTVAAALAATVGPNRLYGRRLAPVGQLFNGPSTAELQAFKTGAFGDGARGFSLFDLESSSPATIAGVFSAPIAAPSRRVVLPTVHPGADGDDVVWAQEHLNGAGAHLPVGGFYGAQTARAVARFQRRHRLPASGVLDNHTWLALLRVRPRIPSWALAPPQSAR
jgi:putative peptidoglycan binding protein